MKNPLPLITAELADTLKDPKNVAAAGVLIRSGILVWKLRNAAKAGNTARAVWLATMLLTSTIEDAERRLRAAIARLEEPASTDPFADLIAKATRQARDAQARSGR